MVLLVGCVAGPIYDRGYLRVLLLIGTFWVVFGHMMLSLCTELWQALLAQGFAVGIGAGCLFVPAVALMPQWFSGRLGMAIGIAASGSSTGGIIYPIMYVLLSSIVAFGNDVSSDGASGFTSSSRKSASHGLFVFSDSPSWPLSSSQSP